ncbi:hypothetical protein AAMO2058_000808400 [Amorphochlora amoebiformis]
MREVKMREVKMREVKMRERQGKEMRIRKLKAEIRKEERERLFQNRNVLQESGRLEMNLADPLSPMAPGMAGKMGLSKNDTKDFGRVLDQANLTPVTGVDPQHASASFLKKGRQIIEKVKVLLGFHSQTWKCPASVPAAKSMLG